jgi:thioredoxin 1
VEEHMELATKYGVTNLPTIFLIKDWEILKEIFGVRPKDFLSDHIKSFILK